MSTTLLQLRTRTRLFLDETAAAGVTWGNTELNQYINDAQQWLWSELCKTDDSFGLREATATLVQAQTDYNYPSDILGRNIRSLYAYGSSTDPWKKVERRTYEEVMAEGTTQTEYPYKYCCMDGFFKVGPPPDASGDTLRIAYTRQPTALSDDGDTMDSDDEYAALIACEAATIALARTGGDKTTIKEEWTKLFDAAFGNTSADDLLTAQPMYRYKSDFCG
jgi:hypothetical protein